jgi:hypothetical protein
MEQQDSEKYPKTNITIVKRRKPCPKGTRRNRKTGDCEPKKEDVLPIAMEPIPTRVLNEAPIEETAKQSKESSLEEIPETQNVLLPPSQKGEKNVIIDDVLAANANMGNDFQRKKEVIEGDIAEQRDEYDFLYPHLDDPDFSLKIARHEEFYDSRYDGKVHDIRQYSDKMCNASFELMPHQIFVKNFLSLQTPYNSLLLYHGLGSGKTCSAIGIAEETRSYMKQVGIKQRILVVAGPNVQDNFRMQLFDERKLREIDGVWNIQSCLGNSLLREVNPTSLKNVPKDKVVAQIRNMIHNNYVFMGYIELANYIKKKTFVDESTGYSEEERKKIEIKHIRHVFNNRLIIIDEVHNIRLSQDNPDGKIAQMLMKVAKYSSNMRLLLLSATPMYNSNEEIIWLTNLMNLNDKRGVVNVREVFTNTGEFQAEKKDEKGVVTEEGGESLLQRKMIGYISYVRGENPYTFPYRVYPNVFSPIHTFSEPNSVLGNLGNAAQALIGNSVKQIPLPTKQLNDKAIETPLTHTPLYVNEIGEYQEKAYNLIINKVKEDMESSKHDFADLDKFGFRMLQTPLEALNMVYPSENLDRQIAKGEFDDEKSPTVDGKEGTKDPRSTMVGKRGLYRTMNYIDDTDKKNPMKHGYSYKPEILEKYGAIFSEKELPKYSSKMAQITQSIKKSQGIVMIYTQYIDGGVVPLALALEEMGFGRFGTSQYTNNLFANAKEDPLDALTMTSRSQLEDKTKFKQAKYTLITGDKAFSPQNAEDLKEIVSPENKDGSIIKVVIISKAGSEGLDFKNIRQIHILDPWYNMNRIEQIIGRAVRNLSHCILPFEERNVEIYMHCTSLTDTTDKEAADVYVYRLAKNKALKIGTVTRLMKEIAVDCIVNIGQTNFTVSEMATLAGNQNIEITLSSDRKKIPFQVGDKPFSDVCDYMENCSFQCRPDVKSIPDREIIKTTYSTQYADSNDERIRQRVTNLFRDEKDGKAFYSLKEIIGYVNVTKQYPLAQIYATLTKFVKNKNEYVVDKYGRRGSIINRGSIYAFQPIEINDEDITVFERKVPVEYKRNTLHMELRKEFSEKPVTQDDENTSANKTTYESLLQQIKKNVLDATTTHEMTSSDQNWYRHASRVMNHIQSVHKIGLETIKAHVIRHNIDFLMPEEKLVLVSHFYSKIIDDAKLKDEEKIMKEYLDTKIVTTSRKTGIVMADKTKWIVYMPSSDDPTTWIPAEPEDIRELERTGSLQKILDEQSSKYNQIIGFIDMFRNGNEMVFRLKDVTQMQNNVGTRISAQTPGKSVLLRYLNQIVGSEMYSLEQSKEIMQLGICVIIEILLREFNSTKKEKVWFLNPEKALYNKISKYRATK